MRGGGPLMARSGSMSSMLRMLKAVFWAYFQLPCKPGEGTPFIPEKFHCMGLVWIVWCPAHLSRGHMGTQGIYRLAAAPAYSYTTESNSPQRRGSWVSHWSFPRWWKTLTMFKHCFQVNFSIWKWVQEEGVHECLNHGCSAQARHYIIALASD